MTTIEANTIALNDKKAFEIFLNALMQKNVTNEDSFEELYDIYNEKFQKKMAGRQLSELLLNAVEHLAKQGQGHKWMRGTPEEQIEEFNKEGFERLLKLNPPLKDVWKRHSRDAEMFLPEGSAFAELDVDKVMSESSEEKLAGIALKAYNEYMENMDGDVDNGETVRVSPPLDDFLEIELEKHLDLSEEEIALVTDVANELDTDQDPYKGPTKDIKVKQILEKARKMQKSASASDDKVMGNFYLEDELRKHDISELASVLDDMWIEDERRGDINDLDFEDIVSAISTWVRENQFDDYKGWYNETFGDEAVDAALEVIDGSETDEELEALAEEIITASEEAKLDNIYQDSINKLEPYWNSAREKRDETVIVDEIISHYAEELSKVDLSEEKIVDLLTEWAFNGIT